MLKHKNSTVILSWVAVFLWMLIIFILSAQPAVQSSSLSRDITEIIIEFIGKWLPLDIESSTITDLVSKYNYMVRKSAHFFAYFILAILVMNATKRSGLHGFKWIIITLLICILYAISDEVHQLFVPGRGGRLTDVLIDSIGSTVGIGVYLGIGNIGTKISKYFTRN